MIPMLALLVLSPGCKPKRVGPTNLAQEPTSHPAPRLGEEPVSLVSEACGDRAYERRLTLAPDGTYSGLDLVAPCPPTAHCVWSGVVEFSGAWSSEGEAVQLYEDEASSGPGELPRPEVLVLDAGGFRAGDCAYAVR